MDRRFIVIVLLVLSALGVIFWASRSKKEATSSKPVAAVSNHTAGAGNKGVELIEYGDFQCPSCGFFFPILQQVKQKYGDDIKFSFRHFPLDSIHPNARAAHRAGEAASMQGKFWEMHDLLYQNQESWSQASNPVTIFDSFAEQLGLDMAKYKTDFQSEQVNKTINADITAGQAIKANSTPTFVLNGKVIDSETQQTIRTLESFSKIIDEAIAKNNSGNGTQTTEQQPAADPSPAPSADPMP